MMEPAPDAPLSSRALRRRPAPWLLALLAYIVLAAAVLAPSIRPGRTVVPLDILDVVPPYVSAQRPHNPLPSDAAFQFYPWYRFLGQELRAGNTPAWNPLILAGVPVAPNGFVTTEYPPYWFVRWLQPTDAYNLYVLFHLVVGAMGLYAFSRVLGVRPLLAWVAGAMGFSALMWVHLSLHLVHLSGMVWIGFVLAAVHRTVVRPSAAGAAAIAVTFGLSWLGAGTQFSYFGTLAVLGYGLLVLLTHRRDGLLRPAAGLAAGFALGALIAAPLVIPSLRATDDILRRAEPEASVTTTHLESLDLVRLVLPDGRGTNVDDGPQYRPPASPEYAVDVPFVGVAALVLSVGGIAAADWRRRIPLVIALVVVFALAFLAWPNSLAYAVVPGYNRFRVSARWAAVLPAFVIPLAAIGLAAVCRGHRTARIATLAAAGAAVLTVLIYVGVALVDADAPRGFLVGRGLVALLSALGVAAAVLVVVRVPRLALALTLVVVLGEAAFHTTRWYGQIRERGSLPEVPVAKAAQRQGGRIIRLAKEYTQLPGFPADVPMAYGLADAQGWAVIFPRDIDRYLRTIDDYGNFALAYNTAPPIVRPERLESPLLDALDVRTVVSDGTQPVPADYRLLDAGPPAVYARPSPGPAVVVPTAVPATEAAMWRAIRRPTWEPTKTSAVVGLRGRVDGGRGRVRRISGDSDSDRWSVDAPDGGLLRVSARYAEGWEARIDGRRTPVLRADGIFRSVVVPPGRHNVAFSYRNPPQDQGRRMALLGLIGCGALVAAPAVRRRVAARSASA